MELVDMIDLGSIGSNIVQVQVLPIVLIIGERFRDPSLRDGVPETAFYFIKSVSSLMDRAQDFDSCW
jgi:hypothetical protein